jgi:cysteine desulfurase family protein
VRASGDIVYLDHAATSRPKPPGVTEAVVRALEELGSPGRGAHECGLAASRTIFQSRTALAGLIGAPDPRDLVFQCGCTQALNLLLKGTLRPGDRVVVTSMEHNAVVRPLAALMADGVIVDVVQADAGGLVDADAVEALVRSAPTRAVVCQHASNLTGTIQPLPDVADIAHAAGAVLIADGAQAVGHLEVDVSVIGADGYAASGHKGLPGPQGVGMLYLSAELDVSELLQGGTGSGSESEAHPTERPARYEAGTPNTPGIAGVGAAVEWSRTHGRETRERERALARRLAEGLTTIPGVRLLGPAPDEPRVPIVSVVAEQMEPDRIAFELDDQWGIAVRAGLHCAPWAHRTVGTEHTGAVRFGIGWCTTEAQVDTALAAMRELLG